VLSGCAILDAICSTWPVGRLRVADRGIREGILFDLMHGGEAGA
jgi:exopolyphosphatase / guanosine-5'-triphosphate,3'-diphosphate pyrophosphatase